MQIIAMTSVSRKIGNIKRFLNVGAENHVLVLTLGILKQVFDSNNVIFGDCHHCPF